MIVTIAADVHQAEKKVFLSTDQKDQLPPMTFSVKEGDVVQWKAVGVFDGWQLQVRIQQFPGSGKRRLFTEGPEDGLSGTADVVVGTVDRMAAQGEYFYELTLVRGAQRIPLRCLWVLAPGQPAPVVEMGGGVKTDPPPG